MKYLLLFFIIIFTFTSSLSAFEFYELTTENYDKGMNLYQPHILFVSSKSCAPCKTVITQLMRHPENGIKDGYRIMLVYVENFPKDHYINQHINRYPSQIYMNLKQNKAIVYQTTNVNEIIAIMKQ